MGLCAFPNHIAISAAPDVFFCIRKHYETDKVEMLGIAPPAAYTAPNLYITRAITCRYKSHRQIKFWRDSLAGINSGIQPGETAVTRTCVRPLVLSFPPSLFLSLLTLLSLFLSFSATLSLFSPSHSWRMAIYRFIHPTGKFCCHYTRAPSAIISSARRCGLFSSLIRTNAGSRFHQSFISRSLILPFAISLSAYISDN